VFRSLTFLDLHSLANASPNGGNLLWYDKPAANWTAALPVGNGSLGGMIFGGTDKEQIQFNEQTLWTGDEIKMGAYQPFFDWLRNLATARNRRHQHQAQPPRRRRTIFPADCEWGEDRGDTGRAMKAKPDWFLTNEAHPGKNRKCFVVWYYHRKDTPLLPSGLPGPVTFIPQSSP